MVELTNWRISRILPVHVGTRREAPMRTLVLLAALVALATPTTSAADEEEGTKDQTTARENIVVGGDFPGSFKIPGPDRPPPPPSR